MLPGVGIFGSEPVAKILIDILKSLEFEIHGIWTNHFEVDSGLYINGTSESNATANEAQFITTKIDNVLLNKNINLVFVCCQPTYHSQIASKALGIGKNVICLSPTSKKIEEISHMIHSARYYPSLISSIDYGGLKYLPEFKYLKEHLSLIGHVKSCNIHINCQNLAIVRHENSASTDAKSTSDQALNWFTDSDLGAGVLNRFGAAMISFVLNLFEGNKVTQVFGNLQTFFEDLEHRHDNSAKAVRQIHRKITADDHCSFQMCLEPSSIVVNVVINSLAQCKYSQEIIVSGHSSSLVWQNSQLFLRTNSNNQSSLVTDLIKKQNTTVEAKGDKGLDKFEFIEVELSTNEPGDRSMSQFLTKYHGFELKHPEMPFIFIRGLYAYILKLKEELENQVVSQDPFSGSSHSSFKSSLSDSIQSASLYRAFSEIEDFEHTRTVQTIIKEINKSHRSKRWVSVNY